MEPVANPPAGPVVASPKADPETLALRAQPARAIRFKRGAIAGIAGAGAIGLLGTAWIALSPTVPHIFGVPDDTAVVAKNVSESVNALPGSYADVPKLGPPLPGDLGRPILAHQQSLATAPEIPQPAINQSVAVERDKAAADLKAARESGLIAKAGEGAGAAVVPMSAQQPSPLLPAMQTQIAIDPDRDPNAQQSKADFMVRPDRASGTSMERLVPPSSPYMLAAGSVISASLITGLNSDLPGLVTAQVTERVYDSPTGRILLIPQGARILGTYDSVVAFGQRRALVVWQRLILPDGSAIRLENVPATDASGYAGLSDAVDFHTWTLLKGVAMSTLLGVGANLTFSGESDLVQAIRESTQQNVSRAGDQLTSRNLQVQPTITIRPGGPVRLLVHQDLILSPWHQ